MAAGIEKAGQQSMQSIMYETGDYVICRNGGVWRVSGINADKICLVEHERGTVNLLPANDDELVRKIVSKETILEIVERIGFIRTIQASNEKVRRKLYDEAMAKYDEVEWAKVIKTVYLRQKGKRLLPFEPAYSEKAKSYLHGEISILLEVPVNEVEDYIFYAIAKN
ncbi:MAG: CarD family transcriptional regulator [Synergistaceae bacterium]|jgi:CarD family transcriptional regulator|nr:CarD family transcriptional regulator [Synergistaceae bacterium]